MNGASAEMGLNASLDSILGAYWWDSVCLCMFWDNFLYLKHVSWIWRGTLVRVVCTHKSMIKLREKYANVLAWGPMGDIEDATSIFFTVYGFFQAQVFPQWDILSLNGSMSARLREWPNSNNLCIRLGQDRSQSWPFGPLGLSPALGYIQHTHRSGCAVLTCI